MRNLSFVFLASLTAMHAIEFPKPEKLKPQDKLPAPLIMLDGGSVTNAQQWREQRAPELRALFEHYMYGKLPAKPAKMDSHVSGNHDDFLQGKARLKLVTLAFGNNSPQIDLMIVTPKAGGPSPTFLALNFCGNHAISPDPRIPLTKGWLYDSCKGCTKNRATDSARGGQALDWPIEDILNRGYALAAFCTTDIDSDRAEISDGIYRWLDEGSEPHHRGSIAAWAWGFHRALDYLVTDPAIDPKKVIAVGHSRNGKTALLAAAFDERFAMAIPHQAGCGGTAPSRGTIGESVKQINERFPHWFNANFKKFNDQPNKLPFDQHCLVALMAPRPVLLSNAVEDQWANPTGQFEVLRAAEPVYKLLGADGVAMAEMPPAGRLVDSKLGYYIREGKHSMNRHDWGVFLTFADKHLK